MSIFLCRIDWFIKSLLSYDRDRIDAGKGCVGVCNFCIASFMFLLSQIIGCGINVTTHGCTEITCFLTRCIIRVWKTLGLCPHAFPGPDVSPHWQMDDFSMILAWVFAAARVRSQRQSAFMWVLFWHGLLWIKHNVVGLKYSRICQIAFQGKKKLALLTGFIAYCYKCELCSPNQSPSHEAYIALLESCLMG